MGPIKELLAQKKDVVEVLNAIKIYEDLTDYKPSDEKSFLKAHLNLMETLIDEAGKYRKQSVGIVKGTKVEHLAPPFRNVPYLMKVDLRY